MAINLGDAVLKLITDNSGLISGLKSAEGQVKNSTDQMSANFNKTINIVAGVGVAMGAMLVKAGMDYAKTGDEIYKFTQKTGFSAQTVSQLKYQLEILGGSMEGIQTAFKLMAGTIVDAGNGGEAAIIKLNGLGLSIDSLTAMNSEQQFMAIANAIREIEDPTMRVAAATDIFGRSAQDLIPWITASQEEIQNLNKDVTALNLVFTDDQAAAANAVNDNMETAKQAFIGLKNTIGEIVAGPLAEFAVGVTAALKPLIEFVEKNPAIVQAFMAFAGTGAIYLAIMAFFRLMLGLGIAMAPVTGGTSLGFAIAAAAFVGISGVIGGAMAKMDEDAKKRLEAIQSTTRNLEIIANAGNKPKVQTAEQKAGQSDALKAKIARSEAELALAVPGSFGYRSIEKEIARLQASGASYAYGGVVPGPIGQPQLVVAHGGEEFAGVGNKFGGVTINLGVVPGDDVTVRKFARMLKDVLGEEGRRNAFGSVNQGYFFGRSSI